MSNDRVFGTQTVVVMELNDHPKMGESYEYLFRAPFPAINAAVFYHIDIAAMHAQMSVTRFETHGVVHYNVCCPATGDRADILVLFFGEGVTAIDCQPGDGNGLRDWSHAIVAQVASDTKARCIQIAHIRRFL